MSRIKWIHRRHPALTEAGACNPGHPVRSSLFLTMLLHYMTLFLLFTTALAKPPDAGRQRYQRMNDYQTTMSINNKHNKQQANNLPASILHNSAISQNALAAVSSGGISSLISPRSIEDFEVSDFILVCSIDGSLHARDRQTGLEIWSIPGERPLAQVSSGEISNCNNNGECPERDLIWIVEPLGEGNLFYFTPELGLQQLPISIKDLVLQSPFALHGDDKIYTGSRHTTLFSIDSATGKVLKVYGSGKSDLGNAECKLKNPLNNIFRKDSTDETDYYEENEYEEEEEEEEDYVFPHMSADKGSFLIGRTDYMLEIHGKNETIWNVTYSTWGPNSVDYDLVAQHYRSPDNIYVTPIYNSSILALSTDGRKKPAQWVGQISTVAISVFDVFRPTKNNNDEEEEQVENDDSLIILPQPLHYKNMQIDSKILSSIYVQKTADGQWFAMSGSNYPSLVHSAPLAPWCSDTFKPYGKDIASAIIGVHTLDTNKEEQQRQQRQQRQQQQQQQHEDEPPHDILAIDSPEADRSKKRKRPSHSDILKSSPMALPAPFPKYQQQQQQQQQEHASTGAVPPAPESKLFNSIVRIMENFFAFVIFFLLLAVATKIGWFPQLLHIFEVIKATNDSLKSQRRVTFDEEGEEGGEEESKEYVMREKVRFVGISEASTGEEEEEEEEEGEGDDDDEEEEEKDGRKDLVGATTASEEVSHTLENEKSNTTTTTTTTTSPKKVEIIEPEKSWREGLESADSPEGLSATGAPNPGPQSPAGPGTHKRRKRGSRGGRNNKNKKKYLQNQEAEEGGSSLDAIDLTPTPSSVALSELASPSSPLVVSSNPSLPPSPSKNILPIQPSQLVVSDNVLGYGSHGTVVLKGEFENREVAVKRMLLEFYDVASHEVSLLQESDDHPNVIRYYCKQQSERFLYIALELCPGTLEDMIEKRFMSAPRIEYQTAEDEREGGKKSLQQQQQQQMSELASVMTPVQIMYQIASGVQHLHSLKIVHRDLKPQNILVAPTRLKRGGGSCSANNSSTFSMVGGNSGSSSNSNSNINININNKGSGPVRMLISDFGLCKRLEGDQSSFRTTTAQAAGTSGWRAPELLIDDPEGMIYGASTFASSNNNKGKGGDDEQGGGGGGGTNNSQHNRSSSEPIVIDTLSNRRATRAIDIFSLGCVFYYILSGGQHPFGDKILREANIVQNSFSLEYLDSRIAAATEAAMKMEMKTKMKMKIEEGDGIFEGFEDAVEARDLISRMISRNPRERPDANMVLQHPLFWSLGKRLDFLLKVSDRFEGESRDPASALLVEVERDAARVVGRDWHARLGTDFVENLGKYRKYHGDRVSDLLRAMRNKSHHFNDLPSGLKERMSPYPEGYVRFFLRRFPYLLMAVYEMVKRNLAEEDMFKPFFTGAVV
ncbi:uncharacterized protein SAPINGB_P003879 [Magnusiomyces paraingens]|uniref:non-specific serine/threonine protein kinase n=1 Tax=Magnusiomyces paraingens TaxID=2606893 RepID=A0A5E8BZ18_9ASCO|nr:uncharacterized protein SAPINGB_P003879 [Saprochaete ingens]VVT54045.1 unnamed protein product [Saprochaete ingens]